MQMSCENPLDGGLDKLTESFPGLAFSIPENRVIRVEADNPIGVGPLVRFLEYHGAEVSEARRMRPSLEDIFVRITGIEAKAMGTEREKGGKAQ